MKKNIAVFGGAFDPIHNGHCQVIQSIHQLGQFDEIWVIPACQSPGKEGAKFSFDDRFEMASLVFKDLPFVKVLDIENKLPKPSYTIVTLRFLQRQFPDHCFSLWMGSDQFFLLHHWKDYIKLLSEVDVHVFNRGESVDTDQYTTYLKSIRIDDTQNLYFHDFKVNVLSSTNLRKQMNENVSLNTQIPKLARHYLKENHGIAMKPIVYGFSGRAGSGKSFFQKYGVFLSGLVCRL